MKIIDLETPLNTEKHFAPQTENIYPFFIPEYGKTFINTPCYQLRMNSHLSCIQYVISGTGVIICDDQIYTVKSGDTFLLPEGTDQIYYSNPDNQFERIWINFKGELSKNLLKIYNLEDTVVFEGVNTFDILSKIHKECSEINDPEEYKNQTARSFLELVQFLSSNKSNKKSSSCAIEQIRLFIDRHIMDNMKISDIAENFSFSKEHIIRIFKKNYGITPHQYILQSKIRLAMIMLKTTDMSIEYISDKLNFSNSHHFSTQFKKIMGYKPSQYRKN